MDWIRKHIQNKDDTGVVKTWSSDQKLFQAKVDRQLADGREHSHRSLLSLELQLQSISRCRKCLLVLFQPVFCWANPLRIFSP